MLLSCVHVNFQGPAEQAVCDLEAFSTIGVVVRNTEAGARLNTSFPSERISDARNFL